MAESSKSGTVAAAAEAITQPLAEQCMYDHSLLFYTMRRQLILDPIFSSSYLHNIVSKIDILNKRTVILSNDV